MQLMNWDDVRIFLALQRQGSLARAARKLDVDPTTVGRRLATLEETLGTTLFERTPSGLVPTASGALLGVRAARIEEEVVATERELGGRDTRLEGSIVVTAGDGVMTYLIVPWLLDLRRTYPGISFELRSETSALDMTRREADVAVRLFRPRESSLVATRAGMLRFGVYGSEEYLARRGRPRTTLDLAQHDWLGWEARLAATPQSKWLARHFAAARMCLRANTTTALVAACAAGLGLTALPEFAADVERRLVPLLPRSSPPGREVWIVTHADSKKNARVRAVVAWLAERLRAETDRPSARP